MFPAFLRRPWVVWLAGTLVAIPFIVFALFYFWLLPNLPAYKDDITALLSSATGYTITVDALEGEWVGTRPRFTLRGARLSKSGRALLYFSRIDGKVGWRTLLTLQPRFHELNLEASALVVRRTADGMIDVGGLRFDPNSPSTTFSDWLLKQGAINVQGATIAWVDEHAGGQPLVLRQVNFSLNNLLSRHQFSLAVAPPPELALPLQLKGLMYGRSLSHLEAWHGTLELDAPAIDLAAWQTWIPPAYSTLAGRGSVRSQLSIEHGTLSSMDAQLHLSGLVLPIPKVANPLILASAAGELGWKGSGHGRQSAMTVYVRNFVLGTDKGKVAGPFDVSWQEDGPDRVLVARALPLGRLVTMADELPVPDVQKAQLKALNFTGELNNLNVSWHTDPNAPQAMPDRFRINTGFTGLGWVAQGERPGASNLTGTLSGDEASGQFSLNGKQAGVDLPLVFTDSALRFDTLNIRGGWKKAASDADGQFTINIAEAALTNADLKATLYGDYRVQPGGGYADLDGRVERATGSRIERYLPMTVNQDVHEWLRAAILKGELSQGTFKLKGDLAHFPFRSAKEGVFQVRGRVGKAQLKFARDYPEINNLNGELTIDGVRLEIRSDKASIYGTQLARVYAVIPDIDRGELLEINGEAHGPASEFIRFVNFSPVSDQMEGLTDEMTASGDLQLLLSLKVPLRHTRDTTAAGRLLFMDNTVYPAADVPRLEKINGSIDFTEHNLTAPKLTATILGGPASLSAVTEKGQIRVRGQGRLQADALSTWLGGNIASRLSGSAGWQGDMTLGGGKYKVHFESTLDGLESRLPAPLRKQAGKQASLVFEQQSIDGGAKWTSLQYSDIASSVWVSSPTASGFQLDRGELRFGEPARLPSEPGLHVAGYVSNFDLGGWVDVLPASQNEQSGFQISGINLTLSSLEFLNRKFHDINIAAKLRGNLLRASVSGRELAGNLTYRRSGQGPTRLSAQFKNFTLPEPSSAQDIEHAGEPASVQLEASNLPALDLQVDDLKLGNQSMGRLEAIAHGVPSGVAIDQLSLVHADSVINMTGLWKDTGAGETHMKANVEIRNIGQFMTRFGYPKTVKQGSATIDGDMIWRGSPADFEFKTLDGSLKLTAKSGQFLKVDPGVGKLLGIASLQSLPRRITLDFRDVFSQGFAFDEISSTIQLARGDLYTNDFLMKGPAATVKMSGVARLQDETAKLRIKVSPKLSEGVAVAGALLGGPVAGIGALVAQKVLKDPLEEAISFEYLVDGSWDNPTVTRLAKPKTENTPDS